MFGLPSGVEILIVLIIAISLIAIYVKWILASFRAFRDIAEIKKQIGFIYDFMKENINHGG